MIPSRGIVAGASTPSSIVVIRFRTADEGLLPSWRGDSHLATSVLHSAAGGAQGLPGLRPGDPDETRLLVVLQRVSTDLPPVLLSPWRMTMFRLSKSAGSCPVRSGAIVVWRRL